MREALTSRQRLLITVACMLGTSLAALTPRIVGTAMPTIVGEMGGLALYPWIFSAYLLASTTTVPIYGRLADLYGRKPIFLFGSAVFLVGSALCGAAHSMNFSSSPSVPFKVWARAPCFL